MFQRDNGKRIVGGEPPKKSQKPKKARVPWTAEQKILLAAAAVLAVTLTGVLAWRSLFVKPELPSKGEAAAPAPVSSGGDGGAEPEEIDYGDGVRPRADGERKSQDFYTVLILGRDTGGGGNTDTMLLASYNVTGQSAAVMSIPRDTMVNIPYDIKRINAVYNYGGGGEKGTQYLYKEISQLVGFEPDYQVVVEWDAVGKIVDAMGGVYFDVPRNMNYDDPFQDLHIHQTKGYRLLTGSDAMQVLRYRHDNNLKYGYPDGDLGRIKTQQALLKAMVEQLLQLKNITKVNEFAKVFQESVTTDLSLQNILWFAQAAYLGGLKPDNVSFFTMPNTPKTCWSRSVGNYQSYVVPNAKELLELVNTTLSPFVEQFTLSDLDIMSVNRDGSVSSTTGYVEDRKAASPPVKPSKPEEPEEDEPEVDENGNPIAVGPNAPGGTVVVDPSGNPVVDPNGGTASPGATAPGTTDPGATDPGTTDPGTTDPGTTDPGATDPGTTDPGAMDPGTTDPGITVPGAADPGITVPAAEDPGMAEPPPASEPSSPEEPDITVFDPSPEV